MSPILPRLGSGTPQAAEELMDRYGGLVWSLARRHTRSAADAEDAVQEIFLALWKNAARFDPAKASEPTFITMIARRRLIDLHRHRQRRPPAEGGEAELDTLTDLRSEKIELEAEAKLAARAVGNLKPKEREIVLLATYHGMSHSEIANHVGMPLGTVKTYIRRGLMLVREALDKPRPAPVPGVAT
ncbi:MAG: sigma-70 family RNA polymerase sigma factor [Acidobacteriota bacterium]